MALLLIILDRDISLLQNSLAAALPNVSVQTYPNISNAAAIEMAIVWKHPTIDWTQFPNLKAVVSFGAGVEHLLADSNIPTNCQLARTVNPMLAETMNDYVVMQVLNIQKGTFTYAQEQQKSNWAKFSVSEHKKTVGILGMGYLGTAMAKTLTQLGFNVIGYSRSPKKVENITCLSSLDTSLGEFAQQIDILVNVLPFTPQTKDVLNINLFRQFKKGTSIISVGRGGHLVEEDLLTAIDEGYIEWACLDVFRQEPLPKIHPFWQHPNIIVTPHIASITNQLEAAKTIAANYNRLQKSEELLYSVKRQLGY